MRTIKPIAESKKWMFHYDNSIRNIPYVSMRDYILICQTIRTKKLTNQRINDLTNMGYDVKKCYVPNYNGIGNLTYMPRLNEIRIIIGRPKNHYCKEVFAVIIKPKNNVK